MALEILVFELPNKFNFEYVGMRTHGAECYETIDSGFWKGHKRLCVGGARGIGTGDALDFLSGMVKTLYKETERGEEILAAIDAARGTEGTEAK